MEINAIRLTRKTATEEDYQRMEQCVDAMQAAYDTKDQYNLADYNFHLAVVSAGHNELSAITRFKPFYTVIDCFSLMRTKAILIIQNQRVIQGELFPVNRRIQKVIHSDPRYRRILVFESILGVLTVCISSRNNIPVRKCTLFAVNIKRL